MRVSIKLAAQLLEALEEVGLSREELMSAVALDGATVSDPRGKIEWDTFAAIHERAWSMLGEDAERMREVGGAVARAPSYVILQRLARTVVSVTSLYELATRWGASASLPHLSLDQSRVSERRLRFVASIPEPHAPSVAFLHLFEGILLEAPTLLGLARSTIVTSHITPRTLDIVIELPLSPSIVGRLRRAFRNAVYAGDTLDLLEEQRTKIAEGLTEVQRSTAEVHEVLERLPDLVIIHRDGVLLWVNRAHVTTLGYETSELVGRLLLDLVEPESRDFVRTRMRQPSTGETPERSEVRLLRRDGQVVVVEISPAQTVTFDGKPARLIVGRDVTERARLQQQLQLADRMASIGMLAAGVAHEVNNPLGYVLNNIEIAIKALAPLGDSTLQSRNALVVALEGVDRIRTIVRDLLTLSRVDDVIVGPVDVLAVVESTLVLASKNISDRAVLSFEHQPVPLTRGTVARLGQVLLNLIANALESMPESSHDRKNELRIVVRPSNTGGAIVEVSDNGVGIAPEHATRVFEPFFTTKGPGIGTGLGLAITLRLVAEMGGLVSFESTPLRGTTFRVTLPPAESA